MRLAKHLQNICVRIDERKYYRNRGTAARLLQKLIFSHEGPLTKFGNTQITKLNRHRQWMLTSLGMKSESLLPAKSNGSRRHFGRFLGMPTNVGCWSKIDGKKIAQSGRSRFFL
jgi:hypothetical protein